MKWISPRAWAVVALAAAMAYLGHAPAMAKTGQGHYSAPLFGMYDACIPACSGHLERVLPVSMTTVYWSLADPPPAAALRAVHRDGLMPIVVLDPYGVVKLDGYGHPSLSARLIASGKIDAYLRWYGSQLASFRFRIGLSFGHEMNGDWYAWGASPACGHERSQGPPNSPGATPPWLFAKAWRHLHDVLTRAGARNLTWVWTVARLPWLRQGCRSPRAVTHADWPGSRYVNWIGIDGYLTGPGSRFCSRLAPTVTFIRTFTPKPILIQETGVQPGSTQQAQFRSLVRGVRRYHLLGWVYENRDGKLGRWTLTRRKERFLGRMLRRDGYGGSSGG